MLYHEANIYVKPLKCYRVIEISPREDEKNRLKLKESKNFIPK